MRDLILNGEWAPGARIPTKLDLRRELDASDGTIQKALHELREQGFLRAHGRLGTFVTQYPPHIHRIGIVLGSTKPSRMWSGTLEALAAEASRGPTRKVSVYFDCSLHDGEPSSGVNHLEEDIRKGLLAGVILLWSKKGLVERMRNIRPELICVSMNDHDEPGVVQRISLGSNTLRAMEKFRADGRSRLAVVATFNHYHDQCASIIAAAADHGLQTRHSWIHYFDPSSGLSARAVMELMMSLPPEARPDAIYITDDHLVHEAVEGLATADLDVSRELTVIGHNNFPSRPRVPFPIHLLGPDLSHILNAGLAAIQMAQEGPPPAAVLQLPPAFESPS
jgi:DNA-binding transcriptional regulator YhcF (GntR family)